MSVDLTELVHTLDATVSYASDPSHPDFHAPRHRLLEQMIEAHSRRHEIERLLGERNADGDKAWSVGYREDRAEDWLQFELLPVRPDDEREPIVIGGYPLSKVERLEREQEARYAEHDAD